jgi:hypothetical protein
VRERLELGVAGRQPAARPTARDRCCYLPREVFFGRLGFAGAFFTVWASNFERFLLATSDSFPVDLLPSARTRASPANSDKSRQATRGFASLGYTVESRKKSTFHEVE